MVWTDEPPLNGMSIQVIKIGATDVTVALVQRVLYALICVTYRIHTMFLELTLNLLFIREFTTKLVANSIKIK